MTNPLVSVIIPTYNRYIDLWRAMRSVGNQTYKNWHLVLIDDGGRYGRDVELLVERVRHYYNQAICYYRQENKGLAAARNKGLELALGDAVVFLDDDDQLMPHYLEYTVPHLSEETPLVSTRAIANENGKYIMYVPWKPYTYQDLQRENQLNLANALMLKTDQQFDETLEFFEDWDYLLTYLKDKPFKHLDIPTTIISRMSGSMTDQKRDVIGRAELALRKKHEI